MKVQVCGSCGILWSREKRLRVDQPCPNCGYGISDTVETQTE